MVEKNKVAQFIHDLQISDPVQLKGFVDHKIAQVDESKRKSCRNLQQQVVLCQDTDERKDHTTHAEPERIEDGCPTFLIIFVQV